MSVILPKLYSFAAHQTKIKGELSCKSITNPKIELSLKKKNKSAVTIESAKEQTQPTTNKTFFCPL